ncbi:MAG: T9SS type A sorting domain-containing protein, partial [Candidatus Poribacteria bacterium]|nr:T9SS type A sorting domain-containing protein [Candidatus Poribacteria bacterium]
SDGTIKLWNATNGTLYKTFVDGTGRTWPGGFSVAFSPNSRTLASGSSDGTIKLWNATNGTLYKTLTGHTGDVESITFSPNGETLASGSADGTVLLWALTSATLEPEKTRKITTDINGDGDVNIQDLVLVAANLGKTGENEADVNGDGTVDVRDLVLVAGALGKVVASPSLHPQLLGALSSTVIKEWLSEAKQLNLTDSTSLRGILFLQRLLAMLTPKETALLPNFPNPFNPETWIPYQLAEPADVSLSIYDVKGLLVRKLRLGHQPAGVYQSKVRAAYWDGRNKLGELVASGVYFYTLTAGNFTSTRKMLILK